MVLNGGFSTVGTLVKMPFPYHRALRAGLLALAVLLLSVSAGAAAGTGGVDRAVTVGQRLALPSAALGETREILVHLPRDYERSTRRYPVLFLLDGNDHFVYASGIVDFLARNGRAPELILVAVPTLHKRSRDLTMPLKLDREAIEALEPHEKLGGADAFLRFLADELAPWLDARYRTQPYRILSGHSLGGLFNFYALLERPDAFQAHVAVSPSLWWDERAWVEQARARLAALPGRHWLYFSWGDDEPSIRDSSQALVDWMRMQTFTGLEWKWRYYPGDDHGTTPLRTLYDGLEWLYADWRLRLHEPESMEYADLQARIRDHHAMLSRRYGYPVAPSAEVRNELANWLFEKERYEEALAEARANLAAHPEAGFLHEQISEILDKQGHAAEALAEYRRSLPQAGEYGDVWTVRHRLEELARKAAEAGNEQVPLR